MKIRLGVSALQWTAICLFFIAPVHAQSPTPIPETAPAPEFDNDDHLTLLDPIYRMGSWIWSSQRTDRQACRFWKSFTIPGTSPVREAILRIVADDYYRVMLDGRAIGQGSDWRSLTKYDIHLLLDPGSHVLAVEAFNDSGPAGVILGLLIKFEDGSTREIASNEIWRIVPNDTENWMERREADPSWSEAKVIQAPEGRIWNLNRTQWLKEGVYTMPPLQRLTVPFWRKNRFQATLTIFFAISVALGLYLAGRLFLQSQEQSVIRRERARIARDIHDELTAGLTQLVVCGESAKKAGESCPELQFGLDEICQKARRLLVLLNETVWVVNSHRDSLRDLALYLCDYAEAFLRSTAIRCRFDVASDIPTLPCDMGIRRNLLLGFKEALSNIVKHSEATELHLQISWDGHKIVVRIEDNGKGFDPAAADEKRNGLFNMKRRALDAGGECLFVSQPGAGCQVEFSVPLHSASPLHFWRRTHMERQPLAPKST